MPLDDWTRVPPGLFHHFHQVWTVEIARDLNRGRLPEGLSAILEPGMKGAYSPRVNRIVVRHHLGRIVAVVEIVSPGNKDSRAALREFVEKIVGFLRAGIHVLVVDPFPPTPRDPWGIHKAIWDEIEEEDFTFPEGKDRILASYQTGGERVAYVEPVGVGDPLPDMPLFLVGDLHVGVSLEATYRAAWGASPEALRTAVETGVVPVPDAE